MPTRRFLRSVRLTIGEAGQAVRITDLLVKFRIRREATDTPAEGHVDVYNLNESNETRIRERAERVVLEAGYAGQLETIFDGDVRRVERQRVNLDRITRVHVGGNVEARTRSIFIRSYEGEVAVRDIVADGVATLGLTLGPLDLIPESAVETDFRYSGPTHVMLTQRLRPLGVRWYEADGTIHFTRLRRSIDDRPGGVLISERSGMVGSPTVTDDGIRVRTLLDPRLRLDTLIRVESAVLPDAASGDSLNLRAGEFHQAEWKIVTVEHTGDNREGQFHTVVEARPVTTEGSAADALGGLISLVSLPPGRVA